MFGWFRAKATDSRPDKQETEPASYTDMMVAELEALALGNRTASATSHAALETACMIYSSCLAAMRVSNPAVTPEVMCEIGRQLIRRGEILFRIELDDSGMIELTPIATHSVHGASKRWRYEAHITYPSGSETLDLSRDEVLHLVWATDPIRGQWQGISPIALAATTMKAAGQLEQAILDESGIPPSQLLAMPDTVSGKVGSTQSFLDTGETPRGNTSDLSVWGHSKAARGKVMVVPSMPFDPADAKRWNQIPAGSPGSFKPNRTGPEFGGNHDPIRKSLHHGILSCCGIPVSLGGVDQGTGTESRESFRRFTFTSLAGLARRIEGECRRKLDDPELRVDLSPLNSADIIGRARSFQALASGGMEVEQAARISGVLADDD